MTYSSIIKIEKDDVLKSYKNKYGYFSPETKEYVITSPRTPRPWVNIISNGDYGIAVSQTGSGYSWRTHAQLNRLTRWEQDLIKDEWGKYIYIRDADTGKFWSAGWKPVCTDPTRYTCRHGMGYTVIESLTNGIESELTVFVPHDEPVEIWKLRLKNNSRKARKLELYTYMEWCLGAAPDWHREFHKSFIETDYDKDAGAIFASKRLWEVPTDKGHWNTNWDYVAFHSSSLKPASYDGDKESFIGMYGSLVNPAAVATARPGRRTGNWLDPIGSLKVRVNLKPGDEKTVSFTVGAARTRDEAKSIIQKYKKIKEVDASLARVTERWDSLLDTVTVDTPDDSMNLMLNTWLKYQAIAGRLWGRTGYYQTGGAYGYRDQLQDSQIFLPIDPEQTRRQIALHARHQFKDGTVYHWWHPISEVGLVTEMTDDLLWLPFVVQSYLDETDDRNILDDREPFIDSHEPASIYDHCVRAIDKVLTRFSDRGLPLIGAGDWNDGLSAVGLKMKGESVWLGQFLYRILNDFAEIASVKGDHERVAEYRERAGRLKTVLNETGWDGEWYYRATKDSGEKLGSSENTDGRVYLNPQTWAVIAGVADVERANRVMDVVEKYLEKDMGPLLLYPSYKTPDPEIGYLTRYSPSMRENGGVYTHAATWAVIASARLKRHESAYRIFTKLNPIHRAKDPDKNFGEPYVTPGNIEGPESRFSGRSGWTWYTGSAAWLFKAGLEWILGVRPSKDGLIIDPCIPPSWKGYTVRRMFRGAEYLIHVKNPDRVGVGVREVLLNGERLEFPGSVCAKVLPVQKAGTVNEVRVTLGSGI
jgi:cellobiose phosphorylase